MKNVLSLSAKEARDFFLKEESYFNFELPQYFQFDDLLKKISVKLENKKLSDFFHNKTNPKNIENINYKLISNKDGKYAWRPLQLIHPALYVSLVHEITEPKNWSVITTRMFSLLYKARGRGVECSSIPVISTFYKKDKAAQIINWLEEVEKKSTIYSLDYDYLYHTDVTDCYGAIYTHSIPWALHDKTTAKNKKDDKALIGNLIDTRLQAMSNGQTNGIPQGSVLMDFFAEMILCYVDSLLVEEIGKKFKRGEYKIIRYRDDYRVFSNNPQIAEQIIKNLADILNDFGMKINSGKTKGANDVVHSSIKEDKLFWMVNENKYEHLHSDLYSISILAHKYPNSGTVVKLLKKFYDRISGISSKKEINDDIKVLISILTDIARRNPKTYPIISAILSKLIDFLPKTTKSKIIKKMLLKFDTIPNTGIMQLWLQRITLKLGDKFDYSEKLCQKVTNDDVDIWCSDWLNANLKKIITSHKLINEQKLKEMGAVIGKDEVELFDKGEYVS